MHYSFQGITIIALSLQQVKDSLYQPEALLKTLHLPQQELFISDFLVNIHEQHTIPNLTNHQSSIYYTKWLAVNAADGIVVADFILKNGLEKNGAVEIGYGVYPNFANKGYMTKCLAAFVQWAKEDEHIKKITAKTNKNNQASIRVLQKNNFIKVVASEEEFWWMLKVS